MVEVDAARRRQFGASVATITAVLRRRGAIGPSERSRERLRRGVAGVEGDLDHRVRRRRELVRGALEQQATAERARRFAERSADQAVKVNARQERSPGEVLARRLGLVEALLHELQDRAQPVGKHHAGESRALQRAPPDCVCPVHRLLSGATESDRRPSRAGLPGTRQPCERDDILGTPILRRDEAKIVSVVGHCSFRSSVQCQRSLARTVSGTLRRPRPVARWSTVTSASSRSVGGDVDNGDRRRDRKHFVSDVKGSGRGSGALQASGLSAATRPPSGAHPGRGANAASRAGDPVSAWKPSSSTRSAPGRPPSMSTHAHSVRRRRPRVDATSLRGRCLSTVEQSLNAAADQFR